MTEAVQIALIASIPGTLAGLGSLFASLRNHTKLVGLEKATNGITSALVKSTAKASHAEGMSDQRAQDRAEEKEDNAKL